MSSWYSSFGNIFNNKIEPEQKETINLVTLLPEKKNEYNLDNITNKKEIIEKSEKIISEPEKKNIIETIIPKSNSKVFEHDIMKLTSTMSATQNSISKNIYVQTELQNEVRKLGMSDQLILDTILGLQSEVKKNNEYLKIQIKLICDTQKIILEKIEKLELRSRFTQ